MLFSFILFFSFIQFYLLTKNGNNHQIITFNFVFIWKSGLDWTRFMLKIFEINLRYSKNLGCFKTLKLLGYFTPIFFLIAFLELIKLDATCYII